MLFDLWERSFIGLLVALASLCNTEGVRLLFPEKFPEELFISCDARFCGSRQFDLMDFLSAVVAFTFNVHRSSLRTTVGMSLKSSGQLEEQLAVRGVSVCRKSRPQTDLPVISDEVGGANVPQHQYTAIPASCDLWRGAFNKGAQSFSPPLVQYRSEDAGDQAVTVWCSVVL